MGQGRKGLEQDGAGIYADCNIPVKYYYNTLKWRLRNPPFEVIYHISFTKKSEIVEIFHVFVLEVDGLFSGRDSGSPDRSSWLLSSVSSGSNLQAGLRPFISLICSLYIDIL
jgi:hypothetical protein